MYQNHFRSLYGDQCRGVARKALSQTRPGNYVLKFISLFSKILRTFPFIFFRERKNDDDVVFVLTEASSLLVFIIISQTK